MKSIKRKSRGLGRSLAVSACSTLLLVGTAGAAVAAPAQESGDGMTTMKTVTGTLKAGESKKVLSGWGKYSTRYGARTEHAGGRYTCYVSGVKISSGALPGEFTHTVVGYGSCFLYSPVATTYRITSIS
ncbi:hypothetical protein [Streptomyces sp. NPDC088752]|uniref:hypothetical protein n=1 Tax=Streptomyces sp. NPDC088752 TaxID=3154963 RepID=UPI003429867D